ncbi:MAG TPA: copper chaperone PCu(A)C [Anaerolineales bacterium]|nr:copper chaperone PCu(A)C [Anaerolineales bacterium]
MRPILSVVLILGVLIGACDAKNGIEVDELWMRPVQQGENGAVYFVIHNHSSQADALTGISSDVAEAAEVHESQMNADVMQMHPIQSLPLEPDAEVAFEPGGYHVMLVGVQKELKVGDEIQITLHFQNSADIALTVPVSDMPAHEENH